MTRPMPGPPGPDVTVGDYDRLGFYHVSRVEEEPRTGARYVHFNLVPHKHLSDAECAAERWHFAAVWMAGLGLLVNDSDRRREHFADTWERFATHPHAFKESRA